MLDRQISPMLAHAAEPFDSPDYLYEIKWDGTRCILFITSEGLRLQNRRLVDITHRYPELGHLPAAVTETDVILDGELVVLKGGKSDFRSLQQRDHLDDPLKIRLLSRRMPATYVVFDILYRRGGRCTREPLQRRKERLAEWIDDTVPGLLESQYIRKRGVHFFREAVDRGLEGIMAKTLKGPYRIGRRSRDWLKIKARQSAVCFIVGYTSGQGSRESSFGALVLAQKTSRGWTYRGKVGSGFSDAELAEIHRALQRLQSDRPPPAGLRTVKDVQWVKPELQCRVLYQEATAGGHFRAPVFDGLQP